MMDNMEMQQIMEQVSSLWPDWEANNYQRKTWVEPLRKLKYNETKAAINHVYANQGMPYKRPNMKAIMRTATEFGAVAKVATTGSEPACGYYIECIEHVSPVMIGHMCKPYYAHKRDVPVERELLADRGNLIADRLSEMYGGQWIVIIPAQKESATVNLCANVAARRQRAEEKILAGPDCAGKRWLKANKRPLLKTLPPKVNDGQRKTEALAKLKEPPPF